MPYVFSRSCRRRRAFTLVELLVVIGIIGVLIGLATAVGSKVMGGAKVNATRNTLQALDQILATYVKANDGRVPAAYVFDPAQDVDTTIDRGQIVPVIDGVFGATDPRGRFNSVGLFLYQCKLVGDAQLTQQIQNLPSKVVTNLPADLMEAPGAGIASITTVLDAWGRPIRYVHPSFDGVFKTRANASSLPLQTARIGEQLPTDFADSRVRFKRRDGSLGTLSWKTTMEPAIRRNFFTNADRETSAWRNLSADAKLGDSDGGTCQGNQPYFYSAGPDGDPSTLEDNVYTVVPKQPRE